MPLDRDDEQRHTSPGAAGVYEGAAPPVLTRNAGKGLRSFAISTAYSFFNSTAGLVFAAFSVCHSTVPKAMASEMMTATTKTQP